MIIEFLYLNIQLFILILMLNWLSKLRLFFQNRFLW